MLKNFIHEFKEFALKGNVIDLAVGVIIGGAFQKIINSLVNDVIAPTIGIFANTDFNYLVVNVGDVSIKYGSFITSVINFLIMAFIIFIFIKMINNLKMKIGTIENRKNEEEIKKCPYCYSNIDSHATRCPNCTSILTQQNIQNADDNI